MEKISINMIDTAILWYGGQNMDPVAHPSLQIEHRWDGSLSYTDHCGAIQYWSTVVIPGTYSAMSHMGVAGRLVNCSSELS